MSILLNNRSTSTTKLLAGVSPVDAILDGASRNAIQNKAVYNALKDKVEKSVNDLIYYYDTSQVYNKAEVRELIGQINTLTIEVVSTLPTQDISTTTIYFVGPAAGTNTYDEYIYNNNAWAKIGDTSIDLTQYVTSANLTTILQGYYTKAEIDNLFNSYYTKTEVDQLLENVEIDVDDALSASSTNPVQNKVIKAKIDDIEDEIDTKQDKEFVGTTAQWNALTTEQKNQYVLVNLTDDKEALGVDAVDAVTNGDMRPVTSNAVYDGLVSAIANAFKPQYFSLTWNEHVLLTKTRMTAFRMNNLVVITAYFETDGTVLPSSEIIATVPNALKPQTEVEGVGMVTHTTQGMQIGKWTIRISGNIQQLSTNSLGTINSFTFIYPINN